MFTFQANGMAKFANCGGRFNFRGSEEAPRELDQAYSLIMLKLSTMAY